MPSQRTPSKSSARMSGIFIDKPPRLYTTTTTVREMQTSRTRLPKVSSSGKCRTHQSSDTVRHGPGYAVPCGAAHAGSVPQCSARLGSPGTQLEAQVDRQGNLAGIVTSIAAFCQRVQN